MPEQERTALLAWRDSPIAKAERAAVLEAARDARSTAGFADELRRANQAVAQIQQKWLAEMKPPESKPDAKGDSKTGGKPDAKAEARAEEKGGSAK